MTAFNGKDNVSHIFNQMRRSADRFGDSARNNLRGVGRDADHASTALRNATKHGYKFGAIVKGIMVANALRGGIGYVTGGLQRVGSEFLQYGDTITGAVARMDGADMTLKGFGNNVTEMSLKVRKAMQGTRYSLLDGAKAFNELAIAGYNKETSFGILPSLTDLATASSESLPDATQMSSRILGALNMRDDNATKQIQNHIHLNDMLARATQLANGGLQSLYETMKTVGPIAVERGMSPEKVFAMALALDKGGILGEEAGTAIKRGLVNFYGPRMTPRLRASGLDPYNPDGSRKDPIEMYAKFGKLMKTLKPEQQEIAFQNLFGMYGLAGNTKLVGAINDIEKFYDAMMHVNGVAKEQAKLANSSPLAKLYMLGNAVMNKSFDVLDQYAAPGKNGIETLIEKVQKFDPKPLIDGLNMGGQAVYRLYKMVEPFMPVMPYLVGAFVSWKVALEGIAAAKVLISLGSKVKLLWDIGDALTAGLGPMGAMKTAVEALGGAIAKAMAPLVAAAPVLSTVLAILAAAGYTSSVARENWGDNRSADDLVKEAEAERKRQAGWQAPNTQAARAQASRFDGTLRIAGAPAGSSFMSNLPGVSPLQVQMLGANP